MEHQAGATHFALALSNYCQNKLKKRTAYIELNPSRQIQSLSSKKNKKSFQYLDFTIYPEITVKELSSIYEKKYDYFVLDMGVLGPAVLPEFHRCNKKYVLCSVAPWRVEGTCHWLDKMNHTNTIHPENVSILGNMSNKKDIRHFIHQYHLPIRAIPFLPNPFLLTSPDIGFFEQIMQGK